MPRTCLLLAVAEKRLGISCDACFAPCRLLSALGLSDEADELPAGSSSGPAAAAADGSVAAPGSSGGGGGSGGGGALAALAGSAEARGHVFSALAQLANRMPDLFKVCRFDVGSRVSTSRSRAANNHWHGAVWMAVGLLLFLLLLIVVQRCLRAVCSRGAVWH